MKCVMFVVAYLSLHEGEIRQKVIMAPSKLEAMCKFLQIPDRDMTESHLYDLVEGADAFISALEM